jgi:hypothetical protein
MFGIGYPCLPGPLERDGVQKVSWLFLADDGLPHWVDRVSDAALAGWVWFSALGTQKRSAFLVIRPPADEHPPVCWVDRQGKPEAMGVSDGR